MIFNDAPISSPGDDRYDVDPFARAVARSIEGVASPEGVVIALNGPWGSGKSSAVNLILHHLGPARDEGRIKVVTFNPWWFSGSESLALAFFEELQAAFEKGKLHKAKAAVSWLGKRLSRAGPIVEAAADLATGGVGGKVAGATVEAIGGAVGGERTVEAARTALAEALRAQPSRFLVVIDDIDRLGPDEALLVFRLVKSVGRLPNVIYLLAFDRDLAERIIGDRFPSEGASYLEKIVQAAFDLPPPDPDELRRAVLAAARTVGCEPKEGQEVRFMNLFYDNVAPCLRTPRDATRLTSTLNVTWTAVRGEVDPGDFLSLETLRLFEPAVHRAIRANPEELCGVGTDGERESREQCAARYDALLLAGVPELRREPLRRTLMRLFPRLEGVWRNRLHSERSLARWRRDRLVCSPDHFPTYFRLALGQNTASASEVAALLSGAGGVDRVREMLTQAVGQRRRSGGTRAALLLDELAVHAADVAEADVPALLRVLFELGDVLHTEEDRRRGFGDVDNRLRLHWLTTRLVHDRFPLDRRAKVVLKAAHSAALGWLADLADRCQSEHRKGRNGQLSSPEDRLSTPTAAELMAVLALDRIRTAAARKDLTSHRELGSILWNWRRLAPDGPDEVRRWVSARLADDRFVLRLAKEATTTSWAYAGGFDDMGDRVARGSPRVTPGDLEALIDADAFFRRVEQLERSDGLAFEDRAILERFRAGWNAGIAERGVPPTRAPDADEE